MTLVHVVLVVAFIQFLLAAGLFLRSRIALLDFTPQHLQVRGIILALSGGVCLAALIGVAAEHGGHLPSFQVISISGVPSFIVVSVWLLFLLVAMAFFVWQLALFLRCQRPHGGSALPPERAAEGRA
jgi:hypothetical protein